MAVKKIMTISSEVETIVLVQHVSTRKEYAWQKDINKIDHWTYNSEQDTHGRAQVNKRSIFTE
ncbi:hypothetical protein LMZ02_27295 [Paenibacillus macerans]|uniref:hypothetical protein n=1 Tax=Paenibacillus macerans TaxID=44252 RepID=UPI001F0D2E41|nr:hypothetical protein [Paenibacillus macerans]MEC0334158.1 hypothetical protein [Paenibacillus macerans]UMV47124.1 hypothetical protein LMZ02_27295 [Paenibacillus macerans]